MSDPLAAAAAAAAAARSAPPPGPVHDHSTGRPTTAGPSTEGGGHAQGSSRVSQGTTSTSSNVAAAAPVEEGDLGLAAPHRHALIQGPADTATARPSAGRPTGSTGSRPMTVDLEVPAVDPALVPAAAGPTYAAATATATATAPPSRKRPRPASPPFRPNANANANANAAHSASTSSAAVHSVDGANSAAKPSRKKNVIPPASRQLASSNPSDTVGALNVLVRLSSDDRLNYALGEGGEKIIDGLVQAFDDAIGWTGGNSELELEGGHGSEPGDLDQRHLNAGASTWDNAVLTGDRDRSACNTSSNGCQDDNVNESWAEFCARRLSHPSTTYISPTSRPSAPEYALLHVIVLIARNLSYVAANGRFLVHNMGMVRVLTGCLYFRAFERSDEDDRGRAGGANNFNICLHALHALMNLVGLLDTTGRKIFSDMVLLDPNWTAPDDTSTASVIALASSNGRVGRQPSSSRSKAKVQAQGGGTEAALVRSVLPKSGYGLAKSLGYGGLLISKKFDIRDDTLSRVPDDVVRTVIAPHVRAALALFPALRYCLDVTANRAAVAATMELLALLVDQTENHPVFFHIPDSILFRLTDLLSVPRLGPESFDYSDPVCNIVSRVTGLKLLAGYDATIDSELRDRSAELLVKLTALGPDLKRRVGRGSRSAAGRHVINCRLYDSLIAMLTCRSGRHDTAHLAGRLLSNLAVAPENRLGIMYLEGRVVDAAGRDANVANSVCNGVLNHIH